MTTLASFYPSLENVRLTVLQTMLKILSSTFQKNVGRSCAPKIGRFISNGIVLNENLAKRLETVSLVGFLKHSGFEVLDASVKFADRITHIDTSKVRPLITVLETWYVTLLFS